MSLKEVFESYVMFGGTTSVEGGMTSVKFMKVLNDAKLLDKKLDKTSADLIFTKAHTKGKPRLGLEQFAHALEACATKRGVPASAVFERVIGLTSTGPSNSGSVAEAVRFHDDKSLYTGVYGKGGPTKIDANNVTLECVLARRALALSRACSHDARARPFPRSALLDRSEADVRGIKLSDSPGGSAAPPLPPPPPPPPPQLPSSMRASPPWP